VKQTDSSTPLIEAVNLAVTSARHPELVLVHDINWQVVAGDYWVVGGSHASGKSDLLSTAAGLQSPGSGRLRLFGADTSNLVEAELLQQRLRAGTVFKNGGRMFAHLTVAENIALPLRYHRDQHFDQTQGRVNALLELTGLQEFAHQTARMIGTNWQQRVGLARALALEPSLLFLDEPLAGLDAQHRNWWLDFLAQLSAGKNRAAQQPTTLVVAVNDFGPWAAHGHQFAFIKEKHWQVLGGQTELKTQNF
jgi:ABC-type transporter Mla maintaining outer membrane lipid asymmetry ATPase subunit MlaF